jgi:hypothetical protein
VFHRFFYDMKLRDRAFELAIMAEKKEEQLGKTP